MIVIVYRGNKKVLIDTIKWLINHLINDKNTNKIGDVPIKTCTLSISDNNAQLRVPNLIFNVLLDLINKYFQ